MARLFLACLVCLASVGVAAAQGRLERVRAEVRSERPADPEDKPGDKAEATPDHPDTPSSSSDSHGGALDFSPFGWCFVSGLFSPFTVPAAIMEDRWDEDYYFPSFPYRNGYPGLGSLHSRTGRAIEEFWQKTPLHSTNLQLTLENGNDFSGLNRTGGTLVFDTTCRLGIVAHWDWFSERLSCGSRDNLGLGDLNAAVTFARTHWGQMRVGLGCRWLGDAFGTDYGFNFHYSGDFFPMRPFVLSASFDGGTIGDAGFVRLRGSAGVVLRHVEIFGGYDYMRIGQVELQGPLVGVRLWY